MKFLSTFPNLQVVLQTKKRFVDSTTGAVQFEQRSRSVKFEQGIFITNDEETIRLMTEKLSDMKSRGMTVSFSIHPENEKDSAIEVKVEKVGELDLKNEIILDLESQLTSARAEIEELKNQIATLSQKKISKKPPAIANTP